MLLLINQDCSLHLSWLLYNINAQWASSCKKNLKSSLACLPLFHIYDEKRGDRGQAVAPQFCTCNHYPNLVSIHIFIFKYAMTNTLLDCMVLCHFKCSYSKKKIRKMFWNQLDFVWLVTSESACLPWFPDVDDDKCMYVFCNQRS